MADGIPDVDIERIAELGKLGENLVERLCIESGLSSTRPDRDEQGWDYLVEFPPNRLPAVFLDAQPPAIKALVQVKATDRLRPDGIALKVSSLERLARTTLPGFVVIADFSGQQAPSRIFVCHLNTERIAALLKKMRELEAVGEDRLSRFSLMLKPNADEEISTGPRAFETALTNSAGRDLSSYCSKNLSGFARLGLRRERIL